MAEALGEAHRNGVVHRDVVSNVVTERGVPKVLDLVCQTDFDQIFGDAAGIFFSKVTRSDVIVGIPLIFTRSRPLKDD